MSFSPIKPCAVKISVGGINALSGLPQDISADGKQDYLALGDIYGQMYVVLVFRCFAFS